MSEIAEKLRQAASRFILGPQELLDDAADEIDRLRSLLNKLVLCFPDKIPAGKDEVEFNIPAYIIEELRAVLKETDA